MNLSSKKLFKYSKISYIGLYDIKKSINTESGISYSYFDECFGINIDFKRNSYSEETLKATRYNDCYVFIQKSRIL